MISSHSYDSSSHWPHFYGELNSENKLSPFTGDHMELPQGPLGVPGPLVENRRSKIMRCHVQLNSQVMGTQQWVSGVVCFGLVSWIMD